MQIKTAKRAVVQPKILLLDIETAPSLGFYFDLWKEGNIVGTVKNWYILSFSYKWLGEKTVHAVALPDFQEYKKDKENDWSLCYFLQKKLDEADMVIAHNGDRFDLPKINARFLKHGFKPPQPYKTVDTLKVARRYFKLDSNRLNDVAKYLGVGSKLSHTGFKLWDDCMKGDIRAWSLMKRYNKQDVVLLEKVYLALRPWMTNHPNFNVFTEQDGCPSCGSKNVQKRGYSITQTGRKQRYQCQEKVCGAWSHSTSEKVTDIR